MRKLLITIVVCLAGCGLLTSCAHGSGKETGNTYEEITQKKAKELMNDDCIILDVRTREEYDSGHIAGAVCIPNETISESAKEELPDKDQMILVYCRSGNRSKQASEKLAALGYTDIKEFGGITTWSYETE